MVGNRDLLCNGHRVVQVQADYCSTQLDLSGFVRQVQSK